jgi:hypothetical protein
LLLTPFAGRAGSEREEAHKYCAVDDVAQLRRFLQSPFLIEKDRIVFPIENQIARDRIDEIAWNSAGVFRQWGRRKSPILSKMH